MKENAKNIVQSREPHFCISMIDLFFLDPLNKLTKNAKSKVKKQIKCTLQGNKLFLSLMNSFYASN